jgi:hypothetical protein
MTTPCLIPPAPGSATLSAPGLLDLELTCDQGWSLEQLQIGFPAVRPVVRSRALADGVFDETTFLGQRAVTATLRIASATATQAAIDAVMPFMSPRRRPTLTWALAGSPTDYRTLVLRGVDAPIVINGPSYQLLVCSWVSTDSFVLGVTEHCESATASSDDGRTYDLTFDRTYTGVLASSSFYAINSGSAPAHWRATITAIATDPTIRVNGVAMDFDQNGGVTLTGSQTLVIDTKARTILLNNDPATPRYDRTNFTDWTWDDLLLQPGQNLVEFFTDTSDTGTLTMCWYDTYL